MSLQEFKICPKISTPLNIKQTDFTYLLRWNDYIFMWYIFNFLLTLISSPKVHYFWDGGSKPIVRLEQNNQACGMQQAERLIGKGALPRWTRGRLAKSCYSSVKKNTNFRFNQIYIKNSMLCIPRLCYYKIYSRLV